MSNPQKHDATTQILEETDIRKQNQTYQRRPYYEGLFVTRIIVKPKDFSKVYVYKDQKGG